MLFLVNNSYDNCTFRLLVCQIILIVIIVFYLAKMYNIFWQNSNIINKKFFDQNLLISNMKFFINVKCIRVKNDIISFMVTH